LLIDFWNFNFNLTKFEMLLIDFRNFNFNFQNIFNIQRLNL